MQIWTPSAYPRDEGEFRVALNPGRKSGGPFATIDLSEDGGTALIMQSVADADRLIKAAVEAKRLLLGEDIPPALEQDLAQADADPANSYGGQAKHGEFTATSAAEVAEGVEGEPPHRAGKGEAFCNAHSEPQIEDDPTTYLVCTAQAGHGGPAHVAFFSDGDGEWSRWPQAPAAEVPADGAR